MIKVARPLFAKKGYANVSSEEIVKRAGLTRGALYHHFDGGKKGLFIAVFEAVEKELAEEIAAAISRTSDAWDALEVGCQAFLEACLSRDVQQIALIDAPSVLGWEAWRAINTEYCFGLVKTGIEAAIDESVFAGQPIEPLSHLILGAIDEAAMLVARADNVEQTKSEVSSTLKHLFVPCELGSKARFCRNFRISFCDVEMVVASSWKPESSCKRKEVELHETDI